MLGNHNEDADEAGGGAVKILLASAYGDIFPPFIINDTFQPGGNDDDDDDVDDDDAEAGGGGAVKIWLASAPPTLCLGRGWVRQWPMLFLKKYQKN